MWFYIHFTMNKSFVWFYDKYLWKILILWWDLESRFHFRPFSITLLDRWFYLKSFPFSIALLDWWFSLKLLTKKLNRYKLFVWFYIDFTMNTYWRHWFSWDLESRFYFLDSISILNYFVRSMTFFEIIDEKIK